MRSLFTILFWTFFVLVAIVCMITALLIWILSTPFDRQRRTNHLFSCFWAQIYLASIPGWRTTVSGREHIARDQAYVLVANHSSIADIVLCFLLYRQFKWVSKASMFKAPILGWNMRLCRYIPLVRGQTGSIGRMMDTCRQWLRDGMSVMMFPEGTRSLDGRLKPFKHGAFTLAQETGVSVVPVAIHGSADLLPKHGRKMATKARLHLEVLPPVSSDAYDNVEDLSEAVRERIQQALGQGALRAAA